MSLFVCGDIHSTLDINKLDQFIDRELEQVRFFQQVAEQVDFKDWYFGHFHEDADVENFHCRIDEVTKIE